MAMTRTGRPYVSLALQGGGAHGAFTGGVLDRLLEEGRLRIEGVTGTSAGAVNAVLLAHGLLQGSNEAARQALAEFWTQVSSLSLLEKQGWSPQGMMGSEPVNMATRAMLDLFRFSSPYQFNPFDLNPLREQLVRIVDFERLRGRSPIKLFVSATHVLTGKIRIFRTPDLTPDVILASACLPHLHHAIEIQGEYYWDGAFSGNPPIYPLIFDCNREDILVVMLHPLRHNELPTRAREISERLIELSTNATFLREMGAIAFSQRAARRPGLFKSARERRLERLRFHLIEANDLMSSLEHPSKYNTEASFINMLWDAGREHAHQWLGDNAHYLGRRSSVDLEEMFT